MVVLFIINLIKTIIFVNSLFKAKRFKVRMEILYWLFKCLTKFDMSFRVELQLL